MVKAKKAQPRGVTGKTNRSKTNRRETPRSRKSGAGRSADTTIRGGGTGGTPAVEVQGRPYRLASFLIHGRFRTTKWEYSHHVVPPISSSCTYRLESATRGAAGFCGFSDPATHSHTRQQIFIYERLDEPTRAMLEEHLAAAENADCGVAFSSGMGAVSAAVGILVRAGDEVVAHKTLYGCTYSLLTNWLPRFGVSCRYVNMLKLDEVEAAIGERTRVVYLETPVNPTLELIDLRRLARLVAKQNAKRAADRQVRIVVDNTFATPFCQRPLTLGADLVLHSLTKNICGFGTDMGGVVVAPQSYESDLLLFRKDFGAVLSSKNAWPILVYGLPTLSMRLRRQETGAMAVARYLEAHPGVEHVSYPGLPTFPQYKLARSQMRDWEGRFAPGNMIYFLPRANAKGSREWGQAFIDSLAKEAYTITLAVSLGQIRTLVELPDSMTHAVIPLEAQSTANLPLDGVRLSIGIEPPEDIIQDLERAFRATMPKAVRRQGRATNRSGRPSR